MPAAADRTTPDPAIRTPAPLYAEELANLGARSLNELRTKFPDLTAADGEIFALGPCTRPDAATRGRLLRSIVRYIAVTAYAAVTPMQVTASYGCSETSGVIVDVQLDVHSDEARFGQWWVLRVAVHSSYAVSAWLSARARLVKVAKFGDYLYFPPGQPRDGASIVIEMAAVSTGGDHVEETYRCITPTGALASCAQAITARCHNS